MERCPWCQGNEEMIRYHDEEWGGLSMMTISSLSS